MRRITRPRTNRFDSLSHEEIQARWRALTPMFVKWLILCSVAVPAVFLLNRYWHPGQQVTNFLAVAFRIAVGGAGLFAFLTVMALVFSRPRSTR
jgi:hypothetical protein